jgi:hypothetical protein
MTNDIIAEWAKVERLARKMQSGDYSLNQAPLLMDNASDLVELILEMEDKFKLTKQNKQKQQIAGANSMLKGHEFEDEIMKAINYKTDQGLKIINYIAAREKIDLSEYNVRANSSIQSVSVNSKYLDFLEDSHTTTTNKCDITIVFNHKKKKNVLIEKNITIKSSPSSCQLHVTSVYVLISFLKSHGLKNKYFERGLKKFCGTEDYRPQDILDESVYKKLEQHERQRFLFHELTPKEQQAIKDVFKEHSQPILQFLFAEGLSNKEHYADYIIMNKVSYIKEDIMDVDIGNLKDIFKRMIKNNDAVEAKSRGGFSFYGVTVQMKGSGTGKARNHVQFNISHSVLFD